jgi:glutathione peroxidase-family protein
LFIFLYLCKTAGVEGPNVNVFTKADVNGPNTRPTYKYLKDKGVLGNVGWNFAGKFIVDKEGNPMAVKSDQDVVSTISKLTS